MLLLSVLPSLLQSLLLKKTLGHHHARPLHCLPSPCGHFVNDFVDSHLCVAQFAIFYHAIAVTRSSAVGQSPAGVTPRLAEMQLFGSSPAKVQPSSAHIKAAARGCRARKAVE